VRTLLKRPSCLLSLLIASAASAVTLDWTPVGDPGNSCDPQPGGCFGAVAYIYSIATYEVTNAQYAEFLNAKAKSDPLGLWNENMDNNPSFSYGGIRRTGTPGNYTYVPVSVRANQPVNYVSFFDAARFANWMNNGQGDADTETGAYTLTGGTPTPSNASTLVRNEGAEIVLPNEDEWFKAAYYDPASQTYFDYPVGADAVVCSEPTATPGHANCGNLIGDATTSGSYPGSASPYGTFDQGGNLWEWFEVNLCFACSPTSFWGHRGGSYLLAGTTLSASSRSGAYGSDEVRDIGFRVAGVIPEPGRNLLLVSGVQGLLVLAGWRRRGVGRACARC
jgi:sulfatase modifying factor 1